MLSGMATKPKTISRDDLRRTLHAERLRLNKAHGVISKRLDESIAARSNCGMALDLVDRLLKQV